MYRKLLVAALLFVSAIANAQTVQQLLAKKVSLPNGWALTPVGKSFPLGDFPLNMVLSKSKNLMAVTNNGQGTQSIQLILLLKKFWTLKLLKEVGMDLYLVPTKKNCMHLVAIIIE